MLYRVHLAMSLTRTPPPPPMLVVIGTDCIGSCKSNYHTITTAPSCKIKYQAYYDMVQMTTYITFGAVVVVIVW